MQETPKSRLLDPRRAADVTEMKRTTRKALATSAERNDLLVEVEVTDERKEMSVEIAASARNSLQVTMTVLIKEDLEDIEKIIARMKVPVAVEGTTDRVGVKENVEVIVR